MEPNRELPSSPRYTPQSPRNDCTHLLQVETWGTLVIAGGGVLGLLVILTSAPYCLERDLGP